MLRSTLFWIGLPIVGITTGLSMAGLAGLDRPSTSAELFGAVLFLMMVFVLVAVLVAIPVARADIRGSIIGFRSVEDSVLVARQKASQIEIAAIAHKIVEQNAWLARNQYWAAKPLLKVFYREEVLGMKPIE